MVAGGVAGSAAMDAFRYRSDSKYYDDAKDDSFTNWWKTSDIIRLYGGLALGGTLFVTRAQEYAEANPEGQKKEGGDEKDAEEGEEEEGEEGEDAEGEEEEGEDAEEEDWGVIV